MINGPTIILFYAPWCSHCVTFKPSYEKIAEIIKDRNMSIRCAAINGSLYPSAVKTYGIKAFPTIGMFRNGIFTNFTGPRNTDTIIQWIQSL